MTKDMTKTADTNEIGITELIAESAGETLREDPFHPDEDGLPHEAGSGHPAIPQRSAAGGTVGLDLNPGRLSEPKQRQRTEKRARTHPNRDLVVPAAAAVVVAAVVVTAMLKLRKRYPGSERHLSLRRQRLRRQPDSSKLHQLCMSPCNYCKCVHTIVAKHAAAIGYFHSCSPQLEHKLHLPHATQQCTSCTT